MSHTLPAGLLADDNKIEFFSCMNMAAYCLKDGKTVAVDQFDETLVAIVREDMQLHPEKIAGIKEMGITGDSAIMNQYLVCNYGGFDNTPDLIDGKLQSKEYWPCPNRGTCKQEGVVCDGLRTDTGNILTMTEIKVLKCVAMGDLDKEIATKLRTKISTVATHTRNIRQKSDFKRKVDFTRFATLKNLL